MPFRRALVEMLAAGFALFLLNYPVAILLGSPWVETLNWLTLAVYGWGAWRLAPGTGGLLRRAARALVWGGLYALLGGLAGYLVIHLLPYPQTYLGYQLAEIPFTVYVVSAVLNVLSPFVLVRIVLALWAAGRARLRWRLTYAFVLVTLLATLLIGPAQGLYVALLTLTIAPTQIAPGVAAQRATAALEPLLGQGTPPAGLAPILQGLLDGSVRLPLPPGQDSASGADPAGFSGVQRITLLDLDGTVLAAVGSGAWRVAAPLPPGPAATFGPLLAQARAQGCVSARPAGGPLADSAACVVHGARGGPVGLLLIENSVDGGAQFNAELNRVIVIALSNTAGTVSLLSLAVVGIVVVAGGGGYWVSRRLIRRLEDLAAATADVAAGRLAGRVTVDSADEIGRLSADFNTMAARLQERDAALIAEKERAERALAANRRLVADVSHELRTPLAILRGYVEALEAEHGAAGSAADLAVIQGEIARLTALIEDLFTLARAEAQQLPLTLEPVDAGALLHDLATTLAPLARRERQIELVTALPPDLPPVVADRTRLAQVLLNLLQNALRYTLPGGIVAVQGSAAGGVVTLAVDDTGVGIPPEELPLVFERFYRGDRSRARESGGAGLGLALVHELVTVMGGQVVVQSTPGQGSRFSVLLPQASQLFVALCSDNPAMKTANAAASVFPVQQ